MIKKRCRYCARMGPSASPTRTWRPALPWRASCVIAARRRKKLIAGGIVGAIVLVGAIAWGVSKFTGNAGGDDAPQLMTTFVDRGDFTEAVEASGAAKPVTSVVVNPEVSGTIETVNVAEGDTVQEGDVLLTVKNDELDKAIRDAEMGVRNAKLGVSQAQSTYDTTLDAYNISAFSAQMRPLYGS